MVFDNAEKVINHDAVCTVHNGGKGVPMLRLSDLVKSKVL